MTNSSSDTSASTPPPTSIEALLQPETVDFCDDRLKALTNWTSVSKDTQFLTNLMSLWHKWEYNYCNSLPYSIFCSPEPVCRSDLFADHYLDWDIFLDEMSNGGTYFCSELLVNSLLASASVSVTATLHGTASIRRRFPDTMRFVY